MPQVLPMTRVEAYLAYKAGVIQESSLKPTLKTNFYTGLEHWLAYWCGLCEDYPVDENNDPKWYNEEEYYIAYLGGIAQDYPTNCYRRVGAYLRHIISYRWPAPEKPLTREEYYLSLINSTTTSNLTPSSNFTINDTTDGAFQGVEVYGDTTQNGEPTPDAPVDVNVVTGEQTVTVTGKNLLGLTSDANITSSGVKSVWNGNEVTMSNTASGNQAFLSQYIPNNLPAGDYVLSVKNAFSALINRIIFRTFDADDNTLNSYQINAGSTSVAIQLNGTEAKYRFVMLATPGATYNHTVSFQLEKGSTATDYQPYQSQSYPLSLGSLELCKIGDYQDYIRKSTGKNLFDGLWEAGNISNTTGANILGDNVIRSVGYSSINGNETYTVSLPDGYKVALRFYTEDGTFISGVSAANSPVTFKAPSNASRVRFASPANSDTTTICQLEKGSTPTQYEPYGEVWYKHKVIAKITLTSSISWTTGDFAAHKRFYHPLSASDMVGANTVNPASNSDLGAILSDYFTAYSTNTLLTESVVAGIGLGTTGVLSVKNSNMASVQDFKDWLDLESPSLYCVLATPTDEEITDAALVAQLEALAAGQSYDPLTNFTVTATDPNLPALLKVTAYKKQ